MLIKTTKFCTLLLGIGAISFLQAQALPLNLYQNSTVETNDASIGAKLEGPNVIISNGKILSGGASDQILSFINGTHYGLGMDKGVAFLTGTPEKLLKYNSEYGVGESPLGSSPDEQLTTMVESEAHTDTAAYEFDVYIADPARKQINVAYQFGSEEYPEFIGSQFNDAFAFFIKGPGIVGDLDLNGNRTEWKNMARLHNPETNTDVVTSINTVNPGIYGWTDITKPIDGNQKNYYINNGHYEATQPGPMGTHYIPDTSINYEKAGRGKGIGLEFGGMTKRINYSLKGMQPGQTYTLKIVIADALDGSMDSGVFVRDISATVDLKAIDDTYEMQAGTTTATSIITNDIANDNDPVNLDWLSPLTANNIVKVEADGTRTNSTGFTISSDGKVIADSSVTPGTYEFEYSLCDKTVGDFCSTAKVTVVVKAGIPTPQHCVKPSQFTGTATVTKVGISTIGQPNAGWPENIPNGHIAMESKEKGFAITQVANVSAIATPVEGMLVYDRTDQCVKLYDGTAWKCLEKLTTCD